MSGAADAQLAAAAGHFSGGRLAEAEAAAKAAIAANAGAPAHNLLGAIQATRGDNTAAAASFKAAAALNAGWDEPVSNLGLLQCRLGDFAGAAESLRRALTLKPDNAAAALNLGNALRELGDRAGAEAGFRRVLAAGGPHTALAYNNLGAVLLDSGRVDEAKESFTRALALAPNLADTHLNSGRLARREGRNDDALTHLCRAAELTPQSATAQVLLANTLRDLGRMEEATAAYRKAVALKPDDAEAGYSLGLILNALGRHAEGLDAIARGPGIAHLRASRGDPALVRRIALSAPEPHFIGAWMLQDKDICSRLIDYFEANSALHSAGRTGQGFDRTVKDSTDLAVLPRDVGKPGHEPVAAYLRGLESCLADYAVQWPHFGAMALQVDMVPFTIQRYTPGGHFQHVHAERMSFDYIHRVLAWMTYLNDVDDGGETAFPHYGLNVRPERGKTLIWPAEWTHVHAGEVVRGGSKYIITGWMHFPSPGPA